MSDRRYLCARHFPKREKGICRICAGTIPKARARFICSPACAETQFVLMSVAHQASLVLKRDNGVCALCGFDTVQEGRIMGHMATMLRDWGVYTGWSGWSWRRGNWQMDHIVPIAEGGGVKWDMTVEEVLANLRTLCTRCHGIETGKLRKRLNEARAVKTVPEFLFA